MAFEKLLKELNSRQHIAACVPTQHTLVLAGAGTGKTKTIVARAAYLISNGTPADRIHILAFTRKSANEIIERVKVYLGSEAQGLRASTFHTWCISLMRRAPKLFNRKGFTVIDRSDQLQLFKLFRGKANKNELPQAAVICDIYSLARNTLKPLGELLKNELPDYEESYKKIAQIMVAYENRKSERNYLDYDDILDVVAKTIATSEKAKKWVVSKYDHLLVDEMQDTNPLQWSILSPLKDSVLLFCVGDDAQSIYGFRGADFKNVHHFNERVESSNTLILEDNYRSYQEILDLSNWLLSQSPLNYGKQLKAVRGSGPKPVLFNFDSEWDEARWIAEDIRDKYNTGKNYRTNMVLVRSSSIARKIETVFLEKDIPYQFIGGAKLLETAHIKDLLSVLRIVGNPYDEIAWMRYLTLWPGIGDKTASKIIDRVFDENDFNKITEYLFSEKKLARQAAQTIQNVYLHSDNVSNAIDEAYKNMEELLSKRYAKNEWEKRKNDFKLLGKLAKKHTSILAFIEEYILDPISTTQVTEAENKDVVTIITIHSAKGSESETCYVINVSPGSYPGPYSVGDIDDIEEERRVLYVALTRAKNELILTRRGKSFWSTTKHDEDGQLMETYFLNQLPSELVEEHFEETFNMDVENISSDVSNPIHVGIDLSDMT